MSPHAEEELERYPKYKAAYLRAFQRMINEHGYANNPKDSWQTPEKVMAWWLDRKRKRAEMEGEFDFDEWEADLSDE